MVVHGLERQIGQTFREVAQFAHAVVDESTPDMPSHLKNTLPAVQAVQGAACPTETTAAGPSTVGGDPHQLSVPISRRDSTVVVQMASHLIIQARGPALPAGRPDRRSGQPVRRG
jgi:hypothetical protein